MANIIKNFPNDYIGERTRFSVGYKSSYEDLIAAQQQNDACFYVVKDVDKYYLYLGDKPISTSGEGAGIVVDSTLSTVSSNPVQNKVVTAELAKAIEVIKDDGTIEEYSKGKFYYTEADTISGSTPSLKFYVSALESIDLTSRVKVVSTYSSTNVTDAINGAGVAEALATLKLVDVNAEPETFVAGTLYRIYDETNGIYNLIYSADGNSANVIRFANMVPTDHADSTTKYGVATAEKYGHAKSGITVDGEGSTLGTPYVASKKDADLVGSNTEAFARVDHKHPYPELSTLVINTTDKNAVSKELLSAEVYDFIQPGDGEVYTKDAEGNTISANKRLKEIENAYISSSKADAQAIVSALTVGGLLTTSDTGLQANKIVTPMADGKYTVLNLSGDLSVSAGITASGAKFNGAVDASGYLVSAGSVSAGSVSTSGNLSIGPNNGEGLNVLVAANNLPGSVITKYDFSAPNITVGTALSASTIAATTGNFTTGNFTDLNVTGNVSTPGFTIAKDGDKFTFTSLLDFNLGNNSITGVNSISTGSLSTTGLSATSFTLNSITVGVEAAARTTPTSPITDTYRLKVNDVGVLTEYDLFGASGLIYTYLNSNYATTTALSNVSNRMSSTWEATSNNVPTMTAVADYVSSTYVPLSSVAGSTVTVSSATQVPSSKAMDAFVRSFIDASVSTATDKLPSSGAVQTYVKGFIDSSVSSVTDKMPSSKAVQTYVSDQISNVLNASISSSSTDATAATSKAVYAYVNSVVTVGTTAPSTPRTGQLWIDINSGNGNGVLKYYDGSWKTVSSVWT